MLRDRRQCRLYLVTQVCPQVRDVPEVHRGETSVWRREAKPHRDSSPGDRLFYNGSEAQPLVVNRHGDNLIPNLRDLGQATGGFRSS